MALPTEFALKTVHDGAPRKYLGCLTEGNLKGYLQYSAPVMSETAKFSVEPAKDAEGLVHIRSCYNNKYWRRSAESEYWIVAAEKEPVNEQSQWNCTLFRANNDKRDDNHRVEFVHAQSGSTVGLSNEAAYNFCLCLHPLSQLVATSAVIDYDSLVFLPRLVTFQGDNDKLLKAFQVSGSFLQFGITDRGSEWVVNEVFHNDDGDVRLKNTYYKNYWRNDSSTNWIWADTANDDENASLFSVKKVAPDVVALLSYANQKFCKRYSNDCLSACANNITNEARLKVLEPVNMRSVKVLNFRTNDARIYNRTLLMLTTMTQKNRSDVNQQMTLDYTYTYTRTSTWANSINVTAGVSTTITAGVPTVFEAGVTVSAEISKGMEWGKAITFEESIKFGNTVTVPARTMVTATLMVTRATCDVPFIYIQTDHLTTGKIKKSTFKDGIYTGVNAFGATTDIATRPLTPEELESEPHFEGF